MALESFDINPDLKPLFGGIIFEILSMTFLVCLLLFLTFKYLVKLIS